MRSLFFLFLFFGGSGVLRAQQRFSFSEPKMGSRFTMVLYAPDSATARTLARQGFRLVDSLNALLSDYEPGSELNRLCATAGKDSFLTVSPVLWRFLTESRTAWQESGGLFDITAGPLTRLWRAARRSKQWPDSASVQAARNKVGFEKMIFDEANHRVQLTVSGMQLDPGGIGQGFIAGAVLDFLKEAGAGAVLIDASGDIVCSGPPPGRAGWTVAVNRPGERAEAWSRNLQLRMAAVTTSGDLYQFFEHAGRRYSHIVDPRTGYGLTNQRTVTVLARSGTEADWLATACSLLPVRKAKRLARKHRAGLLLAEARRGKVRSVTNRRFRTAWKKASAS